MGTRSLTIVQDGDEEICVIYRQMDGYPSVQGKLLQLFLRGRQVVNGYGLGADVEKHFNGMGCLAAQLVGFMKFGEQVPLQSLVKGETSPVGGVYLEAAGARGLGEEYIYTLNERDGRVWLRCEDTYGPNGHVLFDGLASDFDPEEAERVQSEKHDAEEGAPQEAAEEQAGT